jgi:hypothetical protein
MRQSQTAGKGQSTLSAPDDYDIVCQVCHRLRIDCECVPDDECPECGGDLGSCDCRASLES